ncbi:sphingomyelin phosphodiesterase 2 [Lepeophtheirus salmonis]|uniref:sphingomyelin phosphodiesterase 2 n=1 Tax=Lepeophtheirus salmonis TaxID=72036 RepID=UPI001AEA7E38|nr:sphingomyelin phosphodiesterase 2-like [Lepeophtheirus salmonis]
MRLILQILTSVIIPIAHGFEIIQPIGHSLNLKIFTLNNWAIPANPDKEERLKELRTVLRNESFDIFILQGLWMEYDHAAIQASLSTDLNITDFRELANLNICDGMLTRAGCSGLSIVYKNNGTTKQSSSFNLYTYRGSIFTTDGTLGKGIGRLRLKIQSFIVEIFATHVHDSDVYYQDLQTRELMSYVSKSPADLIILGAALQSTPSERPYRNIMTFDDTTKIINTGQNYFPSNWNDPNAHGTFNMPQNKYTPKGNEPMITDFVFATSALNYPISVDKFYNPNFETSYPFNVSLSNHEALGLAIECTI